MADEEKKTTPATTRQYLIRAEREIDLADSGAITKLRDEFGKDEKITVLIGIGNAIQGSPEKAIHALAEARDINGAIEVVTASSVKPFNVKTESKRSVEFE